MAYTRLLGVDDNFDIPPQTASRIARSHGLHVVDPSLGDGVTDATAAIQSKLNLAGADGGIVLIPAGSFMKRSPLTIPDGVTVQGVGRQTIVSNYDNDDSADTVFMNANQNNGGGVTVRDMDLYGVLAGSTVNAYSTLHFKGVGKQSYIHNVHAQGGQRLLMFPDPNSGRGESIEIEDSAYVQVSDVWVREADYDGLKLRGSSGVQVVNVRASDCWKDGIQISGGSAMGSGGASYCTVSNALIEHSTGLGGYGNPAITFHGTTYCSVIGLKVIGTGTCFGSAGTNVGPLVSDAVLRPRNGMGTRPDRGSNVVYHILDDSSPIVRYAWWEGSTEEVIPT